MLRPRHKLFLAALALSALLNAFGAAILARVAAIPAAFGPSVRGF